jgi:hypothetical protein
MTYTWGKPQPSRRVECGGGKTPPWISRQKRPARSLGTQEKVSWHPQLTAYRVHPLLRVGVKPTPTSATVKTHQPYAPVPVTRLRRKPRSPDRGGMRVSSEALAKEDWSFGGLRRTAGATGSCPWGSTGKMVAAPKRPPHGSAATAPDHTFLPQHFLYFFPLPHGQGSFLPIFFPSLLTVSGFSAESP